ncbi:adenylate/guanylate cyclase domain-containing protein [Leisingera sp. M523]|uniref:adenylate/guanylate cyclase domain-containing protein n=1 Tax=Leisingera sp. M523 TaxID=2867013 RepID=UPI0021A643DD|nr:adenylate/guanylate cyclase domain-containing protein [Leisingera sp. M523]UWQ29278.1 response regulator [Leisingera sp. M523]
MTSDGPALLVVDDNEDNRYTLLRRLKREGHENVDVAENGQEALDLLGRQPYDLVLLDIMMPVLNGYETLERMKSDMRLRSIPVIMISAVDQIESVVRCIEAGAEDYLPKPFNTAILRARIHASLEKKRLRDQEAGYMKQIEVEKKRADDLLHATLPAAAVHELKSTNSVRPRQFEDVAVLFCDIVGFTTYCNNNSAETVVSHLQDLVCAFEDIATQNGLEKIKTIGDAFMATAGLLHHVESPAKASVRTGLEMIDAVAEHPSGWEIRIGIHMGPLVGGVIGQKNYAFDIWGDTVNIAARIVDHADPGTVLVSEAVWRNLQDAFDGKSKGMVELKGRGSHELIECACSR